MFSTQMNPEDTQIEPEDTLIKMGNSLETDSSPIFMQGMNSCVRDYASTTVKMFMLGGAALAIANPTLMTGLIDDSNIETLIEKNPKYYTVSQPILIIEELKNRFSLVNENELSLYIGKHPELFTSLNEIHNKLLAYTGIQSINLEHYHDIEEHWEKLYISINTDSDDMDHLDTLEDLIYVNIFDSLSNLAQDHLVLSVS
jgi:hypothetical protein